MASHALAEACPLKGPRSRSKTPSRTARELSSGQRDAFENAVWAAPWSKAAILAQLAFLNQFCWPWLIAIGIISSTTMVIGFARQIPNPDAMDYLRCGMIGLGMFGVTLIFWWGAWMLPSLRRKRHICAFSVMFVAFFPLIVAVSWTGSQQSLAGETSQTIIEIDTTDRIANAGRGAASYVDKMAIVLGGIEARRSQAKAGQDAEKDGTGPTGEDGEGPVWRSFGEAERRYDNAADLIRSNLAAAQSNLDRLNALIQELRAAQVHRDLSPTARSARIKALQGDAISTIRALLALDPARSVEAAAGLIAQGVPEQAGAKASALARIAEIEADMQSYALELKSQARQIAALAPELPTQSSLSPTEQLISTMMRTPALSLSALLLDSAGLLALLWRALLYAALRAQEHRSSCRLDLDEAIGSPPRTAPEQPQSSDVTAANPTNRSTKPRRRSRRRKQRLSRTGGSND